MKRTISGSMGKGSINHNNRKFHAKNTDPERAHLNIVFCNENIKTVYRELFDEALKRYNDKQTRSDRKIGNYYEKIRKSKQEKPFYELIMQVGNSDDMNAQDQNGELAKKVLAEYYQGFQQRNPQLKVFSAHLHTDESTPHLHIDFVPFTTGSKRGLDIRVSLKQALATQGFKGGTRGDTEWNQWVQSEKEQLAIVMERYGIQWEHKGTHEKHLSVLDYEKKMRAAEVANLEEKLADKKDEFDTLTRRIENFDSGEKGIADMQNLLDTDPDYQLPEPQGLMSAKNYKIKFADPLIKKLKSLVKTVLVKYFKAYDDYNRLNQYNGSLYKENERLQGSNKKLTEENNKLKDNVKDYRLLRKVFGNEQIDSLLVQAKQSKERETHFRKNNVER
ncbi:MAG TPA: plasmid recombination protein [Clostridia bacterium]|nr:plasmid recombination protein [Clostridia bacterium]